MIKYFILKMVFLISSGSYSANDCQKIEAAYKQAFTKLEQAFPKWDQALVTLNQVYPELDPQDKTRFKHPWAKWSRASQQAWRNYQQAWDEEKQAFAELKQARADYKSCKVKLVRGILHK